jgi:hypothetical protein
MFVWIGTIAKSFTSGDKGSGLLQADWGAPLVLSVRLTPDAVFAVQRCYAAGLASELSAEKLYTVECIRWS